MKAGEVSLAIAFISGMPKPLVVNDGVMVLAVEVGQCLNELPMDPFQQLEHLLILNSCKVIAIPRPAAHAPMMMMR